MLKDLLHAARSLRKSPAFTAVAVLTLALGIGANTAIFSVVDAALLRPLPYEHPEQLVDVSTFHMNGNGVIIAPDFRAWQQRNRTFQSIGAFGLAFNAYSEGANLSGAGEPLRVKAVPITVGFFRMLGIGPVIGRDFGADEAQSGHSHVALLGASVWRRSFGGDPSVLQKNIYLDSIPYSVVGVMPAGLVYPPGDLWVPEVLDASNSFPSSSDWWLLYVVGRLKPGVTPPRARADLETISRQIDHEFSSGRQTFRARSRVEIVPLRQLLAGDVAHLLVILLGAVGCVLLIACANTANLLLARASARKKELAVRAALGARRKRLIRQLLAESVLLAFAGAALGLAVGLWAERWLTQLVPPELPATITIDYRILAFVIAVACSTVLLFGLAPAVLSSYVDVTETLKQSGERTGLGPRTHRLRGLLVITEMALAVVLLAGAGLLTRSFLRLSEVQLGFDPHHLLLSDLYLPVKEVNQPQRQINFFHQTLERVRALPGVESAAATTHYPVSIFDELANGVLPYGATSSPLHRPSSLAYISSSYFRTLGVPLLKGRDFAEADAAGAQDVVILNESAARALFPQKDSVGNAISLDGPKGPWRQVVGVVGASRNYMLEREPWPEIFIPYRQPPSLNWSIFYMSFVIRTTGDPVGLVAAVRHAVASVDPAQPVAQTQTMADVVGKVLAPRRFKLLLLGSFALLALVLGAFGLYGVVSYAVTERTHEIGVRMALGAERNDVLRMVIGQALALTLVGAGIGITGALALTRYLTSLLYAIKADDPMTFVGASLLLVAIALLSSYIPARRATAVDPMIALRYE